VKTRIDTRAVQNESCGHVTLANAILGLNNMIQELAEDLHFTQKNYEKLAEPIRTLEQKVAFTDHVLQKKLANIEDMDVKDQIAVLKRNYEYLHKRFTRAAYELSGRETDSIEISKDDLKLILFILENTGCTDYHTILRLERGGRPVDERCAICDEKKRLLDKFRKVMG